MPDRGPDRGRGRPRPVGPRPVELALTSDPGAAFAAAHRRGAPLALRTSGTAGQPRRVLRSTASWADSFGPYSRFAELDPSSRLWVPGPVSSTMNLFALVHAHETGATVVDSAAGATHAVLTPSALQRLLADGGARRGLRVVVSGDRLPEPLRARAIESGLRVRHYYGAAELSFVACGNGAVGLRPFPGVEVEIRDGVIWVRSTYLATGYDRPGGPFVIGPDGFATVGDAGQLAGGRLLITGRPDVVVTAGATVLLADVEGVLAAAATGPVAVIGLPHSYLGTVLACVAEEPADLAAARAAAQVELAPAQRPRLWCQLPAVPLTAAGKTDRAALGELVAAARIGRGPGRLLPTPTPTPTPTSPLPP